jgi:citrate synthase
MGTTGLEGVVAASTRLSHVDGERGELVIAGFALEEIAGRATFEETTWLMWHGELPTAAELEPFRAALSDARGIPDSTVAVLRECARRSLDAMDALRMGVDTLSLAVHDETGIVSRVPTIVAAYARLRRRLQPVPPRRELGHAANFLYMLGGSGRRARSRS